MKGSGANVLTKDGQGLGEKTRRGLTRWELAASMR